MLVGEQEPKNLAPFVFEKLRVVKENAAPKPAYRLLPAFAASKENEHACKM